MVSFPKIRFTLSYGFVLPLLKKGEEGNGRTVNGGIEVGEEEKNGGEEIWF